MLNIITALKAEAVPIIEGLALKPQSSSEGYSIFSGRDVRLGISGMGCANAVLLTDYFLRQNTSAYWLNFGIAGSAGRQIGELVLAQTVRCQSSAKVWTLSAGMNSGLDMNLPVAHIHTVESPQTTYHGDAVYDMEAAGMTAVLSERGLLDNAFFVKIISDGTDRAVESLTKQDIQNMLTDSKQDILTITKKIYVASLAATINPY